MATQQITRRPAHRKGKRRAGLSSYLFLFPYLVFLAAFGLGPAIYAIIISFTNTMSDSLQFNGLTNYISTVQDFRFWPAMGDVLLFVVIWLPMLLIITTGLALLLHARPGRFSSAMRLVYFLPGAITGAANVVLWIFMLDPQLSPFGVVLRALGFKQISDIFGTNLTIVFALMAFSTAAGTWIVVTFGAFQSISPEIMEAARIDGCGGIQSAFRIKIPLISRYIIYAGILNFTAGLQLVVEPLFLSQAGYPVTPDPWTPNLLATQTYVNQLGNFGAGAAISMWLLIIALIGALFLIFKTDFFKIDIS